MSQRGTRQQQGRPARRSALLTAAALFTLASAALISDGGVAASVQTAAPVNDQFADATPVGSIPFVDVIDTMGAGVEAGEPEPSCTPDIHGFYGSVWYRFDATRDGVIVFDTFASHFDTVLAAYTGTGVDDLTERGCDSDFAIYGWSRMGVSVSAGETYYIQVGQETDPVEGLLDLNAWWVTEPIGPDLDLDFGYPLDEVLQGYNVTYSGQIGNGGTDPASDVTYVVRLPDETTFVEWRSNDASCEHDGSAQGGTVSCDVGTVGVWDLQYVYVETTVPDDVLGDITADAAVSTSDVDPYPYNDSATSVVRVIPRPPPPLNDDFADAITLGPDPYSDTVDTTGALIEDGEPQDPHQCSFWPTHTVWYRYTATDSSVVTAANAAAHDSTLAAWQGTSLESLSLVGCDHDYGSHSTEVDFSASAGETYYFQVGAWGLAHYGETEFTVSGHIGPSEGFVAGTVSDNTTGSSLGGITVQLFEAAAASPAPEPVAFAETITAGDGSYQFTVPVDDYGTEFDVVFSDGTGFYQGAEVVDVSWSLGDTTVVDAALDPVFTDIYGHWALTDIFAIYYAGISGGYSDGTYRPDGPPDRAEGAVFDIRALDETPTTPTADPFPDVPKTHWAAGYIERLVQLGIAGGYEDGTTGRSER